MDNDRQDSVAVVELQSSQMIDSNKKEEPAPVEASASEPVETKKSSTQTDLTHIADSVFHVDQIRASAILSRLPSGFLPTDCLVIDEGASPILYKTISTLINCVPMFVVTPGAASIKSDKGLLGYIPVLTLKTAIELCEKEAFLISPKVGKRELSKGKAKTKASKPNIRFHLIIFLAKEASPVLSIITKIIIERLKPGGAAIIYASDAKQAVDPMKASIPLFRIIASAPFMNYLLPSVEIIAAISTQKE
jgi:hypothetical protein